MNWAAGRPGTRSPRRPTRQAKLARLTRKTRACSRPAHVPADLVTRTPPKPGASDLELAHPVTNDSEAGRALGRAAAATSATLINAHSQQQPLSPPPAPSDDHL